MYVTMYVYIYDSKKGWTGSLGWFVVFVATLIAIISSIIISVNVDSIYIIYIIITIIIDGCCGTTRRGAEMGS